MSKELENKIKESAPKVKEQAPKAKDPCKQCTALFKDRFESQKREHELIRESTELRETIYDINQKVRSLESQNKEEKKRRNWTKGLIFGLFWGAGAIIFLEMIICTFLNLFNVI